MALIKCYECSKEISDKAEQCPNCGAPKMVQKAKLKKEKNPQEKLVKSERKVDTNINFQNIKIFLSDTLKKFLKKIPKFTIVCFIILIILISIDYIDSLKTNRINFWRLVPEMSVLFYFGSLFYFLIAYLLYSIGVKYFNLERIYVPDRDLFKDIFTSILNVFRKDIKSWDNKDNSSKSIKEEPKFDRQNPMYKSIKITNILLLFVFFFIEIFGAIMTGKNATGFPLLIYFFFSRAVIRGRFRINPKFKNKIVFTFGVWVCVFCIYNLIVGTFLYLVYN